MPRVTYPELIERDRAARREQAAGAPRRLEPPHARPSYPRRRALNRDLARYYEGCRTDPAVARRFPRESRQKSYCAGVAWKRVHDSGRYPDYPTETKRPSEPRRVAATKATTSTKRASPMRRMPPRDPKTGKFLKRGSSGSRRSTGARRASETRTTSAARGTHRVKGYSYKRGGKTVRVPSHMSREAKKGTTRSTKGARRSSGSRRAPQTNIAIVPVGTMAPREAKKGRSRGRGRSRAREAMYEAPLLTAGGVALLFTGVFLGDMFADAVDRYLAGVDPAASPAPTLPSPYTVDNPIPKYNNDSQAMQPGLWRIVAQLVPGLFFIAVGGAVKSAALKVFLYGFGGGFLTHLGAQIVTAYIIVPMVKGSTGMGARMYQHEINVYNALANPSGGILGAGIFRNKGKMGAPPAQLPQTQPGARVPVALAAAASPAQVPVAAAPVAAAVPANGAAPQTMGQPPAAHQAGCGCAQCKPADVEQLPEGEWGSVWRTIVGAKAA